MNSTRVNLSNGLNGNFAIVGDDEENEQEMAGTTMSNE